MSALKWITEAGYHSRRQSLAGTSARHVTKPDKSPLRGQPFGSDGVCPLCEYKTETQRRRLFHPRTANEKGMVAGITFRTIKIGGLELFAKQTRED
jgi:hypothetical protein